MPKNFSGRREAVASSVMLREEVLETKMASGFTMGASLAKASFFSSISSIMASKTMSTLARSFRSVVAFRRPSISAFFSSVILPLIIRK